MGRKKTATVVVAENPETKLAEVRQEMESLTAEIAGPDLFAKVKKEKGPEFDPEHLEKVSKLVPELITAQELSSFGFVSKMLGFPFNRYKIPYITKLFRKVMPGADALVIGKSGEYNEKVKDQHQSWLVANGFKQVQKIR